MSWREVGESVRRARGARRQTQADFAHEIGLSVRLVGALESGETRSYEPATIDRVEAALGWAHGSVQRVVEGGRPVIEADPYLARVRDAWPRLPPEFRRMLAELAGYGARADGDKWYPVARDPVDPDSRQ
jgi:transcriptional regulator with XRE-family HTH domain